MQNPMLPSARDLEHARRTGGTTVIVMLGSLYQQVRGQERLPGLIPACEEPSVA